MRTPLFAAGALAVLVAIRPVPDLEDAKKKLRTNNEGAVKEGTATCVELDSPEAAALLLEVLSGANPHFRDVAFEGLEKFKNPYAIALVEKELVANKSEPMRAWCADLLGAYAGHGRLDPLHKALNDGSVEVKTCVARALGRLAQKESAPKLAGLRTHAKPELRATAWIAWARCDPSKNAAGLADALADKDAGVRAAVLGALAELAPDLAVERSKTSLADPDWRVRLQAVSNLDANGTTAVIPTLIEAVEDRRPVVAHSAEGALRRITQRDIAGKRAWLAWWETQAGSLAASDSRPASAVPESKPAERAKTGVTWYGLPVDSDHIAFLVDRGASMARGDAEGTASKMEVAIGQLEGTLRALPPSTRFNVFAYSNDVTAWEKKTQAVGPKTIASAVAFLRAQNLAGRKNIWDALQAALEDPEIDTIYLMTDGEPQDGEYVHSNRIVDHLRRRNAFRKVVIHAVTVADPQWADATREWYLKQIRDIAKGMGGLWVEK